MAGKLNSLDIVGECRSLNLGLWRCPTFLVILMGFFTVTATISTYLVASHFVEEPEMAALIVIFITAVSVTVGNLITTSFYRLADAAKMKSEFISIISHQLRSPLSVFRWTLDILERQLKKNSSYLTDTEVAGSMEIIRETNEKMIDLVNSLLEVSRIDSRDFLLKKELVSLTDLTKETVAVFKKYFEASNLVLRLNVSSDTPQVLADPGKVKTVLKNLIDNAIRYSNRGGIIAIFLEKTGKNILWSISDQGVGIPVDQQRNIFQIVFRADNAMKYQTKGSGIGLFVSRVIVEGLGGKIGFKSQEGVGSTFWFTLPITK